MSEEVLKLAWFPMENEDWDLELQRKIEAEAKSFGQYLMERGEFVLDDIKEEDIAPVYRQS